MTLMKVCNERVATMEVESRLQYNGVDIRRYHQHILCMQKGSECHLLTELQMSDYHAWQGVDKTPDCEGVGKVRGTRQSGCER